jgi:hypothetical protein
MRNAVAIQLKQDADLAAISRHNYDTTTGHMVEIIVLKKKQYQKKWDAPVSHTSVSVNSLKQMAQQQPPVSNVAPSSPSSAGSLSHQSPCQSSLMGSPAPLPPQQSSPMPHQNMPLPNSTFVMTSPMPTPPNPANFPNYFAVSSSMPQNIIQGQAPFHLSNLASPFPSSNPILERHSDSHSDRAMPISFFASTGDIPPEGFFASSSGE